MQNEQKDHITLEIDPPEKDILKKKDVINLLDKIAQSKENKLNERLLLSPSISQSIAQKPKPSNDINHSVEGTEEHKENLLPFDNQSDLPASLLNRKDITRRKWLQASKGKEGTTSETNFVYNEEFTILVADDSPFVLKGLEAMPIKYKRKLEFAKNGEEAVKKYRSNFEKGILYHLILMDLEMPLMDGFEAAQLIRAEEEDKNIPPTYICAMSGHEEIGRAKHEMDCYYQKPLKAEILNSLIEIRCEQIGITLPK